MLDIALQGCLQEQGVQQGVSHRQLGGLFQRAMIEQTTFQSAFDEGAFSFWETTNRESNIIVWRERLQSASHIIIVCGPFVAKGLQTIDTPFDIVWVRSLVDDCPSTDGAMVILLAGDPWIDVWMHHHQLRLLGAQECWYCVGDGLTEDIPTLPNGVLGCAQRGIADERFVIFSDLALALQRDWQLALEGIQQGVRQIQESSVWDNPSLLLACVRTGLGRNPHWETIFTSSAEPVLLEWLVEVDNRIQAYQLETTPTQANIYQSRVVSFGDEGAFNQLVFHPNRLSILMRMFKTTKMQSSMLEAQIAQEQMVERWLQSKGMPYLVCTLAEYTELEQMKSWSTREQISLMVCWIHASLLSVALKGADPLGYEGADQWRESSTKLWNRLNSPLTDE